MEPVVMSSTAPLAALLYLGEYDLARMSRIVKK